MPYMYQAAFLCDKCGEAAAARLGPRPEEPFDTDDYPDHYPDVGEVDCPQSCDVCLAPLEHTLTSHGVQHVLDAIRESLQEAVDRGRAESWDKIHPCYVGTYWEGSRHVEIVREWTQHVSNYSLDKSEKALVALFLELSEPANPNPHPL